MTHKTIILFIVLFVLIVAGMFTYAMLRKAEIENQQPLSFLNF